MKVVVFLYDLGYKQVELTKSQLYWQLERYPQYKDKVYVFKEFENITCNQCSLNRDINECVGVRDAIFDTWFCQQNLLYQLVHYENNN